MLQKQDSHERRGNTSLCRWRSRYFKPKHHSLRLANVVCIGCISNWLSWASAGVGHRCHTGLLTEREANTWCDRSTKSNYLFIILLKLYAKSSLSRQNPSVLPARFSLLLLLFPASSHICSKWGQDPRSYRQPLPDTAQIQPRACLSSAGKVGKGEREDIM